MKKKFWRSLLSMAMCLALVVGTCIVPASAATKIVSDTSQVTVNGAVISMNTFSTNGTDYMGELIVDTTNFPYPVSLSYIVVHGPDDDCPKPGPLNAFPIVASTSNGLLDYRIELTNRDSSGYSINFCVRYNILTDVLTLVEVY